MSTSSLYPPPPLYAFNEGITRGEMLPPMIPTITARAFGEVTPVPSGGPQQPELVNVREIDTKSIASSSSASASSSLLALNAELLLVYIDVFHTLCTSPSAYARKVENLQVLIWNIKHRYVDQIRQYQYATSLCHLCLCLLSLRRNLLFPAVRVSCLATKQAVHGFDSSKKPRLRAATRKGGLVNLFIFF